MKRAPKFTDRERVELQILHTKGYSARDIAKVFGRSPNTIASELKRGVNHMGKYEAGKAAHKAYVRRHESKYQGMQIEQDAALRDYVITGLKEGWNPNEISGSMRATSQPFYVSKTAIYTWLYSAYGQPYCQYLPSKRHRPKQCRPKTSERTMVPNRVSIAERPLAASDRAEPGHWEGDTVVSGKRSGGTAALAVVQERTSRLIAARLIPNMRPVSFTTATNTMLAGKLTTTLTLDNGIENKQHTSIATATGADIYFCDAYSSWQKGGVEHANKMLRRYFPKGCNLGNYDQAAVDTAVGRLNRKPRKILGYRSALQLAEEKGVI